VSRRIPRTHTHGHRHPSPRYKHDFLCFWWCMCVRSRPPRQAACWLCVRLCVTNTCAHVCVSCACAGEPAAGAAAARPAPQKSLLSSIFCCFQSKAVAAGPAPALNGTQGAQQSSQSSSVSLGVSRIIISVPLVVQVRASWGCLDVPLPTTPLAAILLP
jgi:hypothetical protein